MNMNAQEAARLALLRKQQIATGALRRATELVAKIHLPDVLGHVARVIELGENWLELPIRGIDAVSGGVLIEELHKLGYAARVNDGYDPFKVVITVSWFLEWPPNPPYPPSAPRSGATGWTNPGFNQDPI